MDSKLLFKKGLSKTLVREKKNVSEGEIFHERDLFHIRIMTLIFFGLLIFFDNYKSPHPGFSESVKNILGSKVKKHKIAIWNSVKQNVSEGENWR